MIGARPENTEMEPSTAVHRQQPRKAAPAASSQLRTAVPIPRVPEMVGRGTEVGVLTEMVLSANGGHGGRVLIHGPPGVGKATVMAAVARSGEVRALGGLHGWLHAGSDAVFRRQLVQLFQMHCDGAVLAGTDGNESAAIDAIRHWLATHRDWVLFVADAADDTITLWQVLPAAMVGRVVVTSRQPLHEQHADFVDTQLELGHITTDDSIEMFRRMGVLTCKVLRAPRNTGDTVVHGHTTPTAAAGACDQVRRKGDARRRSTSTNQFVEAELARPELRVLLEGVLGNMPLSVSLCGRVLRADPTLRGVPDLVQLYGRFAELDRGRDGQHTETRDDGLQLSVRIVVDRLKTMAHVPEEVRRGAVALLAAMSVLHSVLTPESLLGGHGMDTLLGVDVEERGLSDEAMVELVQIVSVFMDDDTLRRARGLCVWHGLLQQGDPELDVIGAMPRQVQACLRRELVGATAAGQAVAQTVRRMLLARFNFDATALPTTWETLQAVVPCVSAWCSTAVCTCGTDGNAAEIAAVSQEAADSVLVAKWGALALHAEGNVVQAERLCSRGLDLAMRLRSPDDRPPVELMADLAFAYTALGQNDHAVQLEEAILEVEKQTLPRGDLAIVPSMQNLMSTYSHLGRHADAARIGIVILALMRAALPTADRQVALCMLALGTEYSSLGQYEKALELEQDALTSLKHSLPSDDPRILSTTSSLARTCSHLGLHDKAALYAEDILAIRLSVLPTNGVDAAAAMGQLATVYAHLGRPDDAVQLCQDALDLVRQECPPQDPRIPSAMHNLAAAYSRVGRHHDAVPLTEEALAVRLSLLPDSHPDTAVSMEQLGLTYSAVGRHEDASSVDQAVESLKATHETDSHLAPAPADDTMVRIAVDVRDAPRASPHPALSTLAEERFTPRPRNHDEPRFTAAAAAAPADAPLIALASQPSSAEVSVLRVRLIDYLAGHCLRTALMAFEGAVGPWVKAEMAKHFPDSTIEDNVQAHNVSQDSGAEAARLEAELLLLNEKLNSTSRDQKDERKSLAQQKMVLAKRLKALKKCAKGAAAAAAPPTVPRWVEQSRLAVGRKMTPHVHADNRWDTHIIVAVMRANLKGVFAQYLPDDFHAKELLTRMAGLVGARNRRSHREKLVEADVLGALDQAATILKQCHASGALTSTSSPSPLMALGVVTNLLDEAKRLVERGRCEDVTVCTGPTLSVDECNAQLLYDNLTRWETLVEQELGAAQDETNDNVREPDTKPKIHYQDGTIAFGKDLDPIWDPAVKKVKSELEQVARARHWYFHHLEGDIHFPSVYGAMAAVTDALAAVHRSRLYCEWQPPTVMDTPCVVQLTLDTPSAQATVPVAQVHEIVGRDAEIDVLTQMVVSADGAAGSRVLIHGPPGVGKDTVMAEVVHRIEVRSLGGLQGWLQASSDVVFRRQLIGLFEVHRPNVISGAKDTEQATIDAIRHWLASNQDWVLFVEDAGRATDTLWEVLPADKMGRAVVTSQQPLYEDHPEFTDTQVLLDAITTADSINMFRKMNIFSRKAPSPPVGETEEALKARCVAAGAPGCFIEAPSNERKAKRKDRRKMTEAKLFEHAELARPELTKFLHDTLGNLPLSVSLCGHMLRADTRLGGVLDLIDLYGRLDLADVDEAGRNLQQDTHYYGLQLSIRINLDRLMSAADLADEDRQAAVTLLAAVSMLHHTLTPVSLLEGHDVSTFMDVDELRRNMSEGLLLEIMRNLAVFMDVRMLHAARRTCVQYGLLRQVHSVTPAIGMMHQQVQKGLRKELVAGTSNGSSVGHIVRKMLLARFTFSQAMPSSEWAAQRELVPCVSAWCAVVTGDVDDPAAEQRTHVLPDARGDGVLLTRWYSITLNADGNGREAVRISTKELALAKRMLPPDHPDIATSMNNLASAYTAVGRHNDALHLEEDVLDFQRRTHPPDDPHIANAMSNLMTTYFELGRYHDAARLGEETVAFRLWVQPQDHPDVALSMGNLAAVYSALGRHDDAVRLHENVFEIRKRVLPPDHPHIAEAMLNLAATYAKRGRYEDALQLEVEAVNFMKRVLPPNHPTIGSALNNLGSTYYQVGRYTDAARATEEALAIRQRALPPDHPHVAAARRNLDVVYEALQVFDIAKGPVNL